MKQRSLLRDCISRERGRGESRRQIAHPRGSRYGCTRQSTADSDSGRGRSDYPRCSTGIPRPCCTARQASRPASSSASSHQPSLPEIPNFESCSFLPFSDSDSFLLSECQARPSTLFPVSCSPVTSIASFLRFSSHRRTISVQRTRWVTARNAEAADWVKNTRRKRVRSVNTVSCRTDFWLLPDYLVTINSFPSEVYLAIFVIVEKL